MPSPANPQSLNRYAYTLNNPLRYTDPTGHKAVLNWDEEGNPTAIENPVTGNVQYPTGFVDGKWCALTLAECFGHGYKILENEEYIDANEFTALLGTVYDDLQGRWTPMVIVPNFPIPLGYVPGVMAGRDRYDTPLWNTYEGEDTIICLEEGCYPRSHVNYVAQGMWGAKSGERLDATSKVVDRWNQGGGNRLYPQGNYNYTATPEGKLFWTEYGYNWYLQKLQSELQVSETTFVP